jgi:hypothetical protein
MPAKGAIGSGQETVIKLDDSGGSLRTLTSYVTKVSLDLKGHGLVDVTCFGDTGHKWESDDLEDGSFNLEAWFDDTATTGSWTVLAGLRTDTAANSFEIYPFGETSGYPKISGECWMESCNLDMGTGGITKITAAFKVNGAVTIGTAT